MIINRYHPYYSGKARFISKLSQRLLKDGFTITVLTAGAHKAKRQEIVEGVTVFRNGWIYGASNRIRCFVSSICFLAVHGGAYDIYHIHGDPISAVAARMIARCYGKKTITETSLLGTDDPVSMRRRGPNLIRYRSFLMSDAFVSISHPITETFCRCNIPMEKVSYMPRMVDVQIFRPVERDAKIRLRKDLGLPSDRTIVVSVGSVIHRKGYDIAVDAFLHAKKTNPRLFFLGVGPSEGNLADGGEFYRNIKRTIDSRGAGRDFIFTGEVTNVHEYLQASDIFIFPSRKEGFGAAIIEAMAAGLPCVVAGLDGIVEHDIFSSKDAGIVIGAPDPEKYAEAVNAIAANDALRNRYATTGRRIACENFSSDDVTKRYVTLYNSLTA